MDSINQQQPEENRKDLQGSEAVKKIKELAEKAGTCFFCTKVSDSGPLAVRPMSVQKVDEEGNFWFLSADDSHKNMELQTDHVVQLLFQGSAHSDFLSIDGLATVSKDKEKIKELKRLQSRLEGAVEMWKSMKDSEPDGHSVCRLIESFAEREKGA